MFESKLDMLLYLEFMASKYQQQVEDLTSNLDKIKEDIEILKSSMVYDIKEYGLDYSNNSYAVSVLPGRKLIVIEDSAKIPDNMMTTQIKKYPSKTAIKEAIEAGHDIDGAELVTGCDKLKVKAK